MPKKIQNCGKAQLIAVPLPAHGTSYTVISHESVIDMSTTALTNAGFTIVDEEYRATADGQIAQGIYKLNYMGDPELSMMFAWTNSYNKQVRFKCGVGAYVNKTGTVMVCGDMGSWARKHTGTADTETQETIDEQVANAYMYYNQLVSDKAEMEEITMNKRKQAQMLGILFAEYQILTTEQASMVRQQMDRPTHVFTNSNSLWAFYNYVTVALQHSHPKTWMEDQRILHMFISEINKFTVVNTPAPVIEEPVDPLEDNYGQPENQTNLLTQIEEFSRAQLAGVKAPEDVEIKLTVPKTNEELAAEYNATHDDSQINIEYLSPEEVKEKYGQDIEIYYTDQAGNTFETMSFEVEGEVIEKEVLPELDLEEEILETEVKTFFKEVEEPESDFDLDLDLDTEEDTDTDNVPDFF